MNKIYKVIWSKARNCYIAVSEIASAHSKGGKRARGALLGAVLAVSLAAAGSVFADTGISPTSSDTEPTSASTAQGQYVAGKFSFTDNPADGDKYNVTLGTDTITYVYDSSSGYWVREGYKLVERTYKTTDLAKTNLLYDIVWTKAAADEPTNALNTVTSLQRSTGTLTNMGEALEALTPSKVEGVSNSAGTGVYGDWDYIIVDDSWKDQVASDKYSNGYTDLIGSTKPLGFLTADDNDNLYWDDDHQCYFYKHTDGTIDMVNYHNTYVLDIYNSTTRQYENEIGVFTKADGSLYTGNVYGSNNEILTTVKSSDGKFYSYWGSMVTDQALTMGNYYVTQYKNDLDTLVANDQKLYRNDIRSMDMKTAGDNQATLSLYRNGSDTAGSLVDGQLTITRTAQDYDADTSTDGKDTQITIAGTYQADDGTTRTDALLTLDTGSRVSVTTKTGTDNVAETITVNGRDYKISLANAAKVAAGNNVTVDEATDTTTGTTTYTVNAIPYTAADDTITIDATAHTIKANSSTIINNAKTDIQNIAKGTDVHVKSGEYSVDKTTGVDSGTVTLTYVDGDGNDLTDAGKIVIKGIADQGLQNITNEGQTVIKNLAGNAIEIKSANDNLGVESETKDGVKTFTLTAKDTTYTAGDSTITIDSDAHTIVANSSTIINNAKTDIQNIAKDTVKVAAGTNVAVSEATNTDTGVKTYTVSATDTTLKETATKKTDATTGAVSWTIEDTSGKKVTLDDLASNTALTNLKIQVDTNTTNIANNTNNISKLDEGAVKYDRNDDEEQTVNYNSVTMGGTTYNSTDKSGGTTITNVAYSNGNSSDAVNVQYLEDKIAESQTTITDKGFALIGTAEGSAETKKKLGEAITVDGANGIVVSSTDGDDGKVTVSLDKEITIGTKGEDGKPGEQGHIGLAGKDGEDGIDGKDGNIVDIHIEKGKDGTKGEDGKNGEKGANGVDGEGGITRIVYTDAKGDHQVATMEDGLKFKGDDDTVIAKKLNNRMDIIGGATGTLTEGNIGVVSTTDGALKVKLAEALTNIKSITNAGTTITINETGLDVGGKKITNVADGSANSDAVNYGQLQKAIEDSKTTLTDKGFALEDEEGNKVEKKLGEAIKVVGDKGINVSASSTDGQVTVSLDNNITVGTKGEDGKDGEQGKIGLAGKDGINGKDGNIVEIRIEQGADTEDGQKGKDGVDGKNGEDGITRIVYEDGKGEHQVATMEDGLKFKGDDDTVIAKKLNNRMDIIGGATGTLTEGNIGVVSTTDGALKVKLAEALTNIKSITNAGTTITINETGLDVGGKKITNVADGSANSDAVNYGQLQKAIEDSKTTLTDKGFALEDEEGNKAEKKLGEAIKVVGDKGINVSASSTDGQVTVSLKNNITVGTKGEDGKDGEQGHIGLAGKDGEDGIDGKDGNIVDIHIEKGKNGEKGEDGKDGEMGANGVDGEDGITRIVYTDAKGDHQVATMEDGLKFQGDDSTVISKKLNNTMEIKGGATGTLTEGNIGVVSGTDGALHVKLAEALNGIQSISNAGTTITISEIGVDVGGKKITNVKAGEDDTDAVNMSQLKKVEADVAGSVKYDKDGDTYNYNSVTMGGTTYNVTDKSGGTTITNVAYSTGNKSDAVNVQYLEDKIADSKTAMTVAEKHIKEGSYAVASDNTVTMEQVNGEGTKTGEVIITDVAKASELGKLNSTTETHQVGKEDGILKDSLKNTETDDEGKTKTTTMADVANKLDDKIDGVDGKVDKLTETVTNYKKETDSKFTEIEKSIEDANANHTALTVNGGTAAPADGSYSDGNLQLKVKTENGKSTYDVKLSDKVTLGSGENTITLDGEKGEASISKKLTVGGENGITIQKLDLGKYTKDVGDHKKGETTSGYVAKGLSNTTTYYDGFADGSGKAATEEQMKEALGDMDFDATTKNQAGETVNKYNIVNTATNVTEAVYQLDQSLSEANTRIDNNTINIQKLSGSLGKLNTRVNRVGAGAAALAALHPLDFDPDDKWDFAAGYGNYAGANATAIGAYYRPNEDTMFSIAGSFGGGENMVNAGVSLKLGRGNNVTTSKVAMAKEIKELRATVAAQGEQIAQLTALVEKLTGESLEALTAPAPAETFTVDTVKEKDGKPVIERVRTVKAD